MPLNLLEQLIMGQKVQDIFLMRCRPYSASMADQSSRLKADRGVLVDTREQLPMRPQAAECFSVVRRRLRCASLFRQTGLGRNRGTG